MRRGTPFFEGSTAIHEQESRIRTLFPASHLHVDAWTGALLHVPTKHFTLRAANAPTIASPTGPGRAPERIDLRLFPAIHSAPLCLPGDNYET